MKLGPPSDLALKGTFYSMGLYVDYYIFKDVVFLNLIALLLFSKSLMQKNIDILQSIAAKCPAGIFTKILFNWSRLGLEEAHLEAAKVERSGLSFFLTSIYFREPIA